MKISVITVVRNRVHTIGRAIASVQAQTGVEVEHIIIDGASTDGTLDVIRNEMSGHEILVSEGDLGIYDALNKGIKVASGDVIGVLHSDDLFADEFVLKKVVNAFKDKEVSAVFGDAIFFSQSDPDKIFRRFSSAMFKPGRLGWGWMPAHTSLFIKAEEYARVGAYNTDYEIAADFEFICRLFKDGRLGYAYLPMPLVRMQLGGLSTSGLASTLKLNKEMLKSCRNNRIPTNFLKLLSRYPLKLLELWRH